MEKVLFNTEQYAGKYVALISVEDSTVVGSGSTPAEALKEAKTKGHLAPVLFYVPKKHSVHIY